MARFGKDNVVTALQQQADRLQAEYGFDPNNGTAQLKGKLATQDAAVSYGKYRQLLKLIQDIEDGSLLRAV